MKPPTLAEQTNSSQQISPLLEKVTRLGLGLQELESLAIQRGCDYYHDGRPLSPVEISQRQLSNEELALTFLAPFFPPRARFIRLAAALLGAEGLNAEKIAELAGEERCVGVVRYIADCGRRFEPGNLFWTTLLEILPDTEFNPEIFPHPTRFVEMTGVDRGKVGLRTRWIRPKRNVPA